jgi:NAD(P)-dependent dehydrogenase (short-subunit alcohol dehydrogenase family)
MTMTGFEIAKSLFLSSEVYHVLIGCRGDVKRAHEAIKELQAAAPDSKSSAEGVSVDISSDESIQQAFKDVQAKVGHVDFLINNAGEQPRRTRWTRLTLAGAQFTHIKDTREQWNQTWDTNVVGTQIMTETFMPLLFKAKVATPRLLFITSGLSSLAEDAEGRSPRYAHPPSGWPKETGRTIFLAYRSAKTGMNMMALDWVRLLGNDSIKVFNIAPGLLATGLGGNKELLKKMGALDPAIGGNFIKDVLEGKRDQDAGKVIRKDEVQVW